MAPVNLSDPRSRAHEAGGDRSGPAQRQGRCTVLSAWHALGRSDLAAHLAHHGTLHVPRHADEAWAEGFWRAIGAAGLTGRGGAAFAAARKLAHARGAPGSPTVVVNAMEGEPASAKDQVLLSCVPHLVLDGAAAAARAVGAPRIVVCVAAERPDMAASVRRAVAERGLSHGATPIDVVCPPGAYVAGEESALVSWLAGSNGAPMWRPDKSVPISLGRGPALVHNAETLAHMALIARYGPDAFRAHGLADMPGTCLVTVSGAVREPGVYEVALGTPLRAVLGAAHPFPAVAAVLTGGYGGTWVATTALDVAYAPRPLERVGGVVGAGVLVVLPPEACGIAETARVARFMAGESAGQCGPCVFGLPALAADLQRLAAGTADSGVLESLEDRCAAVVGRGACRHPDGVARLVRSALAVFGADAASHAGGEPCAHYAARSVLPFPRERVAVPA